MRGSFSILRSLDTAPALAPVALFTQSSSWLYLQKSLLACTQRNDSPMVITAKDQRIQVEMNGEQIIEMDLNEWSEPGKNPDSTDNKFHNALKDFKREGHIGLQDHGAEVAYRNMRIRPL